MGNHCSHCFDKTHDNNIQDLSSKNQNPFFGNKKNVFLNQDDATNINLKNNESIFSNFINNDENIEFMNNKNNNNFKNSNCQLNDIQIEYITILNKYVRGFLLRKHYNKYLKEELKTFSFQLNNKFKEITKNEKIEKILKNEIEDEKLIKYQNLNWSEYYDNNPNEKIETIIKKTKKYKGIRITYKINNTWNLNIEELIVNIENLYEGEIELLTGKKCGFGKEINRNTSIKLGNFYNNNFNGWNKYINSEGIFYIGLFKNNELNGKGIKYDYEKKNLYEGDFLNGLEDGNGIEINNENKYEGEFKKGEKSGKGKLIFKTGDIYEGNFLNNKFNGEGHYIWKKNGNEYIGNYKNNLFDGDGFYKWNNNEYYKGEYKNGIKEGKGEIKKENGDKFICNFVNGKPHGIGFYENNKGKRKEIEFINGKLNKKYKKNS